MVALVAALAALAVAGRLVFAPIPNVVATTDIVLITGFAVGAAPGFAVGALAAVVSNFWLGQGPWTPWQMAGWGLVGVGGAALAAATRPRLGRVGLAVACGIAGLAYGALLDLSVMVTYGGEQSLDRYLAISARGVPFNVAHARRQRRPGPRRRPGAGADDLPLPQQVRVPLAPGARALAPAASGDGRPSARRRLPLSPSPSRDRWPCRRRPAAGGPRSARQWLERAQDPDGGFGASPGSASSAAITGWAVLGLEAPAATRWTFDAPGHSPIAYLRSQAGDLRSTGDLERTILALDGAGVSPREVRRPRPGGRAARTASASGSFEGEVNLTAFGVLALRAAGASGVRAALAPPPGSATPRTATAAGASSREAGSDPDSTGSRAPGPGGGRRRSGPSDAPGRLLSAARAARRRRLRAR